MRSSCISSPVISIFYKSDLKILPRSCISVLRMPKLDSNIPSLHLLAQKMTVNRLSWGWSNSVYVYSYLRGAQTLTWFGRLFTRREVSDLALDCPADGQESV